jgi:ParB/RepB/Spo0J family partition protein
MSQVDKLQDAEEAVAQMRETAQHAERRAREEDLRRAPLADTAARSHQAIEVPLAEVSTMVNMRVGPLPDLHELAVSIRETGLLHPPLVRATDDPQRPYELLAGRRRFAAMALLDEAGGTPGTWRFTLVEGISRREALTMQFAENFHQHKPEPVQFARAARAIMSEDPSLTAADVSRMVGAPMAWTRKALRLLELPEAIVQRVEQGDLSFTVAEVVRRGIARGAVSEAAATELVDEHAEGKITGGALKLGVGYVPPKPKDYDEQSRRLDEARWAAARDSDRGDGAQREWDARSSAPEVEPRIRAAGASAPSEGRRTVSDEDLDGYVLGLLLGRVITEEQRAALGVDGPHGPHDHAFALPPAERLVALRALAAELLRADATPPRALRHVLAV